MTGLAAKIVSVTQRGDFGKTHRFLHNLIGAHYTRKLNYYGKMGVSALAAATPKDSGKTAESWGYEIIQEEGRLAVHWTNTNIQNGVNIAIILQYGHGTRNGGWVEGIDYINPAMRPVFEQMADEAWKEVIG